MGGRNGEIRMGTESVVSRCRLYPCRSIIVARQELEHSCIYETQARHQEAESDGIVVSVVAC